MSIAMHMANELLNPPVAAATLALAAAAVALASRRARKTFDTERLPLMGVLGAFVFAAQMINFTLPGMPGTSGHLGGGVLLAIVLGPAGGIVTMTGILIVQCLLFNDGGLLALGCNVVNMGVVPCLLGWWVYRGLLGPGDAAPAWRQYLATWAACLAGVAGGAALVPLEAAISGVLKVPPAHFLAVMVLVHLVIGFIEGLITFAVLGYLRQVRPAVLGLTTPSGPGRLSRRALVVSLLVTAGLLAGVISWFASSYDDGLEWSLARRYGQTNGAVAEPDPFMGQTSKLQASIAPLPEYTRRQEQPPAAKGEQAAWPAVDGWGSLAGLVGTALTGVLVYLVAAALRRGQRRPASLPERAP